MLSPEVTHGLQFIVAAKGTLTFIQSALLYIHAHPDNSVLTSSRATRTLYLQGGRREEKGMQGHNMQTECREIQHLLILITSFSEYFLRTRKGIPELAI